MNTLKKEQFLNGVRIVDFTMNLAGPYATYLLGMLGAEVIRIEHSKRLDVLRRRSKNDFNAVNLNKKSITIDLKNEKGLEIAKKLISKSDVFVESFRPGIVDKLGLGYDELKRIKKNIVMLSLSGFGSTGPERNYASWASIFAAMSGVSYGTGYSDSIPTEFRGTYDTRVGQMVAFAVMTGIIYRQKTGKGQYIDLSAIESQTTSLMRELQKELEIVIMLWHLITHTNVKEMIVG